MENQKSTQQKTLVSAGIKLGYRKDQLAEINNLSFGIAETLETTPEKKDDTLSDTKALVQNGIVDEIHNKIDSIEYFNNSILINLRNILKSIGGDDENQSDCIDNI